MLSALLLGVLAAVVGVSAVAFIFPDTSSKTSVALAEPSAERPNVKQPLRRPLIAKPRTRQFAKAERLQVPSVEPAKPILAKAVPAVGTQDRVTPPSRSSALVAIIIDDMGHSPRHTREGLKLPKQVAFALLPYARASRSLATQAMARGHELIVHMPMEPKNTSQNPGPYALKTGLDATALREAIAWNLDQFDGFYAVNNHMGSAFTEDEAAMQVLFEELSLRGLSFYDSRTTAQSQSVDLADRYKILFAERDVFLDNEIEASAVDQQLRQLELLAFRNGSAIAIGHPHTVTFQQIAAWAQTLEARGLRLVPPSEIARQRKTPYWRRIVKTAGRKALEKSAY